MQRNLSKVFFSCCACNANHERRAKLQPIPPENAKAKVTIFASYFMTHEPVSVLSFSNIEKYMHPGEPSPPSESKTVVLPPVRPKIYTSATERKYLMGNSLTAISLEIVEESNPCWHTLYLSQNARVAVLKLAASLGVHRSILRHDSSEVELDEVAGGASWKALCVDIRLESVIERITLLH